MRKKHLAYYIISGFFALFTAISNIHLAYVVFPSVNFGLFGKIYLFKKILIIALALYVIILNEIARRKKRWDFCFDLIKGRKDIAIEKIDLFIIFSVSLAFMYFSFFILNSFSLLLMIYTNFRFEYTSYFSMYIISCLIDLLIIIVPMIPLFRVMKIYRKQEKQNHLV
ncbi:hypothetical protein [Xenorhabdus sp. PB30.3]|uniref:hypothetical protein n=1 Tax=Xenorhabdus sp. PB30.3 TaxID=2788941 RepID=UPI001E3F238D|nr:hypothetical protein [Xenorhabdus sp. PB30.3]MCC8378473.1 hypothetical protein [Xenorhabdus sp. PB30.3]